MDEAEGAARCGGFDVPWKWAVRRFLRSVVKPTWNRTLLFPREIEGIGDVLPRHSLALASG